VQHVRQRLLPDAASADVSISYVANAVSDPGDPSIFAFTPEMFCAAAVSQSLYLVCTANSYIVINAVAGQAHN
jgi:hypothetical protein